MKAPTVIATVPVLIGACALVGGCAVVSTPRFHLTRGVNVTNWYLGWNGAAASPTPVFDSAAATRLRCLGFDFVRLQLSIASTSPDSAVSRPVLAGLMSATQMLNAAGLSVIVEVHPASRVSRAMIQDDSAVAATGRLVQNLVAGLRRFSLDSVAFELFNEPPYVAGRGSSWSDVQSALWAAARRADPRRILILTGQDGTIDGLLQVRPVDDPLAIYAFHYYLPISFTFQGAWWSPWNQSYWPSAGHVPWPPSASGVADAMAFTAARLRDTAELSAFRKDLDRMVAEGWGRQKIFDDIGRAAAWAQAHRVAVFAGEFGLLSTTSTAADRGRWLADVRTALESYGMPWSLWRYWDWPGGFGLTAGTSGVDSTASAALRLASCTR